MAFDRDLEDLKDLLRRADLLTHWGGGQVYPTPGGGQRVDFQVRIAIRGDAHAKPAGVEFSEADVELELVVHPGNGLETVTVCNAQVVVDGINQAGDIVRFAMHFDRHPPEQASTDLHSRFHWQVGGERLEEQNFGTVLQLQSPRFPYHPIDPVLLVDFVLGHFHGEKRAELMADAKYIRYPRILHAAQTSMVLPFFAELHSALTADPFIDTGYWPALCGPTA